MKKVLVLFVAVIMMAGFSSKVNAQTNTSASESTTVGAQLIVPMSISEDAPMHFGTIVLRSSAAGTVVLPSNSTTRSFTGSCEASTVNPQPTNAAYHVTGTMNETYALTLPTTITVTETVGGVATMNITNWTARFLGAAADALTSTLSANGTDSFTVGATLNVNASQIGGIYAGSFEVSVDYN
ncbi:MAG: DUF4402 domain-containing protein [Bacteroidales bacterium]